MNYPPGMTQRDWDHVNGLDIEDEFPLESWDIVEDETVQTVQDGEIFEGLGVFELGILVAVKDVIFKGLLLLCLCLCFPAQATPWTSLLGRLEIIESGGNPSAYNPACGGTGILQITPILLRDVNRISGKEYVPDDRYCPAKSREMALIYLNHYGKDWTVEQAVRAWNGGPRYSKKATDRYWDKYKKLNF